MAEARLATRFWVDAYRRRLNLAGVSCYVVSRGDETAGAVLVKVCPLDGTARLLERRYDLATGARVWDVRAEGPEAEIDASVAAACRMDPDLWVIEIEDREGRDFLGED